MSRRILIAERSVPGMREHHIASHDDGAHRHLAGLFREPCLGEREIHPALVLGHHAPTVSFDGSLENSNAPFPSGRTTIASPSLNRPSSTAIASGFWIRRWIDRLSGRPPNDGTYPSP